MDKDHLHVQFQTDSHGRIYHMDKEGYVEVPRAEVKTSIRKSPRLQSKEKLSPCLPEAYKYTVKSSVSECKIQEENRPLFQHKNGNSGVFSSHTASMKSSTVVPFFKYQVHAKDGIQLVVDLNVKQSDWLKSMEKEVCTRQNNLKPGCESFRKEVECLGYRNNLKFSSPGTTTLDTSVSVENKFSHNLTSMKTGKSLTSAIEKEVTNVSGCLSKVDQRSELVTESSKVHEIGSPEAECPEIVVFTSEQVQFPDFSKHHKGSVCSTTGKICSEALLTSNAEVDQVTCDNHRHSKESTNSAEGMQVSGRDEMVFVTSASNDGPKRKKCDYESNNIHGQSHARRLRSTKLYGGQIFESGGCLIRRSSRLLS
uniref:uncharacterized protein LOC122602293 n=1 Tax=Erigeron canadensis TaxID=72917 RepID=UPI001CB953C4|nr:uncharacterized protein LOC122602293 [Erigeron canadensis]